MTGELFSEGGDDSHDNSVWITTEGTGEEGEMVVAAYAGVGATAVNGAAESGAAPPPDDIVPRYMHGTEPGSARRRRIEHEVELLTRGVRDPELIAYARKLAEAKFEPVNVGED